MTDRPAIADDVAVALESWAFNVMLECSALDDAQPSEVPIGGAILDLRDLHKVLDWARDVAGFTSATKAPQ